MGTSSAGRNRGLEMGAFIPTPWFALWFVDCITILIVDVTKSGLWRCMYNVEYVDPDNCMLFGEW